MEILWSPLFAAFSVVLERYDDPAVVRDCFDGIQNCVKLLGRSDLDQEKDTFIIFLQKFCPLQNLS
jgi:brefeldin A-inhibited guanine nucleotide-exchange protein